MPETRYIETYAYPKGMAAKDKLPANAVITHEPYEVSDKQLAQEAEDARREELTNKSDRSSKEDSELLTLIVKRVR